MTSVDTSTRLNRYIREASASGDLEKLLGGVLRNGRRQPANQSQLFAVALKHLPSVPGFRDPLKAPAKLVLPLLQKAVLADQTVAQVVIDVWRKTNADMERAAVEFLSSRSTTHTAEPRLISPGEIEAFSSTYPDEMEQAAVMLRFVNATQTMNPKPDDALKPDPPLGERWARVLVELRELPAEHEDWDSLGTFLDAVSEIAADKRAERERLRERYRLQESLDRLSLIQAEAFAFFERSAPTHWMAEAVSRDRYESVDAQTQRLCELLEEHYRLWEQSQINARTRRQLQDSMSSLEVEIETIFGLLEPVFAGSAELSDSSHPVPISDAGTALPDIADPPKGSNLAAPMADDMPVVAPLQADAPAESTVDEDADIASSEHVAKEEEDLWANATTEASRVDTADSGSSEAAHEDLSSGVHKDAVELSEWEEACAPAVVDWNASLLRFLETGDVAAAYWLALSREAAADTLAFPSELLAAVCLAEETAKGASYYDALTEAVSAVKADFESLAQRLLALSAALRAALFAPTSGLVDWLSVPAHMDDFGPLIDALRRFATAGAALGPDGLVQRETHTSQVAELEQVCQELKEWLKSAPHHRLLYQGATEVLRVLISPGGELHSALEPAASDDRSRRDDALHVLASVRTPSDISQLIDRTRTKLLTQRRARPQPITDKARKQLTREIEEALTLARRWCELTEPAVEAEGIDDWWTAHVGQLRRDLETSLPVAERALKTELAHIPAGAEIQALWFLKEAVSALRALLVTAPAPESSAFSPLAAAPDQHDVMHLLAGRLLMCPGLPLDDDGLPATDTIDTLALRLVQQPEGPPSVLRALEGWLELHDLRFVDALLPLLHDSDEAHDLIGRVNEAKRAAFVARGEMLEALRDEVEQAYIDGAIPEVVRVEMLEEIAQYGDNGTDEFNNLATVSSGWKARLRAAEDDRLSQFELEWQERRSEVEQSDLIDESRKHAIILTVDKAVSNREIGLLNEYLFQVDNELAGEPQRGFWESDSGTRDVLADFIAQRERIESWLEAEGSLDGVIRALTEPSPDAPLRLERLSRERRGEALEAIGAWRNLKRRHDDPVGSDLVTLLRFLGFQVAGSDRLELRERNGQLAYFTARAEVGDLAKPISFFGSEAGGRYHVVVLVDAPGAGSISARMRALKLQSLPVLILYVGRLGRSGRQGISRLTREQQLSFAILDETSLVFLCQEQDARLPAFLRIALPYSAINPYSEAGKVWPEMFFGREPQVRDVLQPRNHVLVYGGRQLGKSAILDRVVNEFDVPERNHHARTHDLRHIFRDESSQTSEGVWRAIRQVCQNSDRKIIPESSRASTRDTIATQIEKSFDQHPDRRIIVMLDEADEFLAYDAKHGFRDVTRFDALMTRTEHRFKVIFTGLKRVQAFQHIPNQPLAHFGQPVQVGPLEPRDARRLVTEPLETLGFRFRDPKTVLRILWYTNYHPALIQLFCRVLVKDLRQRVGSEPPFWIEQRDVEVVARNPDVLREMRDRFEWTIRLDERFMAIVWSMLSQADASEVRLMFSNPKDLLDLVRDWWPAAFAEISEDDFTGILNELCGLGVLIRDRAGRYGFRSPTILRLFGDRQQVESRLLTLHENPGPAEIDQSSRHVKLGPGPDFSPLTFAEAQALNATQFGVGLVFCSEALGLHQLPEVFRQFIPRDIPLAASACRTPRTACRTADELRAWLQDSQEHLKDYSGLILWQHMPSVTGEEMVPLIREALDFCRKRIRTRDVWTRILFVFNAAGTARWVQGATLVRREIEGMVDTIVCPRPWRPAEVRAALDTLENPPISSVCDDLARVTGGWPVLLAELFRHTAERETLESAVREVERQLLSDEQRLAEFRRQLGVDEYPAAAQLLSHLVVSFPNGQVGATMAIDDDDTRLIFLERLSCVSRDAHRQINVDPLVRKIWTTQ